MLRGLGSGQYWRGWQRCAGGADAPLWSPKAPPKPEAQCGALVPPAGWYRRICGSVPENLWKACEYGRIQVNTVDTGEAVGVLCMSVGRTYSSTGHRVAIA
eukprot:1361791-Rhodomonas_salina.7